MGGLIPPPEWLFNQIKDQMNKVNAEINELRRRIEKLERGLQGDGK